MEKRTSRGASLLSLVLLAGCWAATADPSRAGEPAEPLTGWARITSEGALEIVSRARADTANFAPEALVPTDDRIVVGVMNHGEAATQPLLSEKQLRADGVSALYTDKNGAALSFVFTAAADSARADRVVCRVQAKAKDGETPPPERAGITLKLSASLFDRPILVRGEKDGKQELRTAKLPAESDKFWHFRSDWHIGKDSAVTRLEIPLNQGRLVIGGFRGPVWFTRPSKWGGHVLLRFPDTLPADYAVGLTLDFRPQTRNPATPTPPAAAAPAAKEPEPEEVPLVLAPGKDWAVLPRYRYFTVPGSALDMRQVAPPDAPAGKFGPVRVDENGDFAFRDRPGTPVRFFGGNLCAEACMPAPELTEDFAEVVATLGYNAVRFHHFDEWLMKPGPEFAVDPERLDRFFRAFAAYKKRGIYSTLDLYISRSSGFGVEGKTHSWTVKQRALYDPEWRDNIAEFARVLLATTNPHTGLALKDDPALIHLTAINENPMLIAASAGFDHPRNGKLVQRYYRDFCAANGLDPENKTLNWELCRLAAHRAEDAFFKNLLREIGCDRPLSNTNSGNGITQNIPRAEHGFYDIHNYYDHPVGFGKGSPGQFTSHARNPLAETVPPFPGFAARLEGKPLTLTEWRFCAPNPYRSVGGAWMGAAAAFQKAGGIYDFNAFTYDADWFKEGRPIFESRSLVDQFILFTDPVALLSNRIPAFFYARGDVKPAPRELVWITPRTLTGRPYETAAATEERSVPDEVVSLTFARRLANRVDDNPAPAPDPDKDMFSLLDILSWRRDGKPDPSALRRKLGLPPADGEMVSPTGEIAIDPARGVLRVVTPRSEALAQPEGDNAGKHLSVRDNTVFSTVFAGSLDGKNLDESGRILVLHLTDVKPSDGEFKQRGDQLLTYSRGSAGSDKKLLRRGRATVTLARASAAPLKLYALDLTGKRLFEVPLERRGAALEWTADNYRDGQCVMAYELTAPDRAD